MLPAIRQWHAKCPEAVSPIIQDALTTRLFLVHESGPLKFTLRDADGATFNVLLGPRHQCSCSPPVLVARGSPGATAKPALSSPVTCAHVIWSLHRRLRIPAASPLLYQTGILDHEWNQLPLARRGNSASAKGGIEAGKGKKKSGGGGVPQRPVTEDDVCPICQESMFESEIPLCFCRQSCGNNIHVPCMKLVADHQAKALGQTTVTCPLCRADFGSMDDIEVLAQEWTKTKRQVDLAQSRRVRPAASSRVTAGPACRGCKKPIRGTRYKCTVCTAVHLCQPCFDDSDVHREHPFKCKAPDAEHWTFAVRYRPDAPTSATIDELQSRDLSDADYALLTSLDAGKRIVGYPRLHVINTFPLKKVPGTASAVG
ncbi:E3 ubiquitin-protein ligase Zswim2 [Allomyces javanicus]|nr:E3 ubiquitin-protein ligase Zswim2 [Allomyces javanicus]